MNHLVTVGLLGSVTMASMVLENAGFVVGFNGATMGSAITYIFPAILAIKASSTSGDDMTPSAVTSVAPASDDDDDAGNGVSPERQRSNNKNSNSNNSKLAKWINALILGFGITSAIAGGAVSIASAFAPHWLQ